MGLSGVQVKFQLRHARQRQSIVKMEGINSIRLSTHDEWVCSVPLSSILPILGSTYLIRMPFGFTHKPLVALANSAITSFFREIEVIGSENVPKEGPVILYV